MKGFVGDIQDQAEGNSDFRRVIYTGKNIQLVLMSLKPGEDIGEEVHKNRDQFFRIEKGKGEVVTAPVIRTEIGGGRVQISGRMTTREANCVALLLRAGALED